MPKSKNKRKNSKGKKRSKKKGKFSKKDAFGALISVLLHEHQTFIK